MTSRHVILGVVIRFFSTVLRELGIRLLIFKTYDKGVREEAED